MSVPWSVFLRHQWDVDFPDVDVKMQQLPGVITNSFTEEMRYLDVFIRFLIGCAFFYAYDCLYQSCVYLM